MNTDIQIMIAVIYFIIAIITFIACFSKKPKDSPLDDGAYYFGGFVVSCVWPLLLIFKLLTK